MTNPLGVALYEFGKNPITQKSDPRYGAILAQQILDSVNSSSGYFYKRNQQFKENEKFATGKQSMEEYLDRMNIDGKQAFVNLDLTPPPIAPKFMEVLLGRSMEKRERPTVTAIDKYSREKKKRERDEAEWRMRMPDLINWGEQQTGGTPLEDREKYTPTDKDDLALWEETELHLDTEVKLESCIFDSLMDSGYEIFKRTELWNILVKGMGVAYVYRDANGRKKYKWCRPENTVYTTSERDDFADCKLIGEIDEMKISDAREYYPEVSEEDWFKMYTTVHQYDNDLQWNDSYKNSLIKPYDDCIVKIFRFSVITNEDKHWVIGSDKYGKPTVDEKTNRPEYPNGVIPEGKEVVSKRPQVVYDGCYSVTTKKMLHWRRMENMIKPHYALHEVFTPFCVVMPNNINMSNVAMAERCAPSIRQLTLTHLKIQQLIAKMRPDGYIIDINGLHDIDLGLGKSSTPLELQSVADQTGNVYYSSMAEDGETRLQEPIRPTENNNVVSKLQSLIQTHNFYLQRLRDDLGTNEYVEGQGVNPKLGMGVRDGQVAASNRATDFVYRAYINLLEQIAKRFAVMEWYDIIDGRREGDYGMRGEDFYEFIPDIQIEMLPTDEEQLDIINSANTALTAGIITFEESFKIRRLARKNVKLAEIFLSKYEKRRKAQAMAENQANIKATATAQQQSNAQTHANQTQIEQIKNAGKIDAVKVQLDLDKNKFIQQLILTHAQAGTEIPPMYMPLVSQYLTNASGSQALQQVETQIKGQTISNESNQHAEGQMQ